MLENERIIVQDRGGIDAGIAALMQNANKGFDPAALMAMMNNGNGMFGGNADNRLSICQQTNTLQNAITSGFCNLSSENATRFNILGAKIDAQTQIINDKFCQLEMREMQNKIDTLRDEKNALQSSALLQQQTSNIVSQIKPCPVPAYLTCNPYGCNGGLNGYGYGYPYGYGDSCCA